MASILNNSFENWNFGTLITDPTDGQQLADHWFWHKGSVVPSVIIQRQTIPSPFDGTYQMRAFVGSGGFGTNLDTYVYQDITPVSDLAGKTIIISAAVQSQTGGGGVTGHIFIDDGLTVTSSTSNSIDNTWHILYVVKPISPSATRVRIGLMPNSYGFTQVYFDFVSFGTVLNFSEFSFLGDTVKKSPIFQALNEVIRTDEWVNLQVVGSNQWTNSDNNNQFPPQP